MFSVTRLAPTAAYRSRAARPPRATPISAEPTVTSATISGNHRSSRSNSGSRASQASPPVTAAVPSTARPTEGAPP